MFIDMKRVEFSRYKDSYFNQMVPVARDASEAIKTLAKAEAIMRMRYEEMETLGKERYEGMRIFVVIDELADLVFQDKPRTIKLLSSIARLGRAAGIHLICATQTPRREVLSSQVMSNFPVKIALRCDLPVDYRTILGFMPKNPPELAGEGVMSYAGRRYLFRCPYVTRSDYEYFHRHTKLVEYKRSR